MKATGKLFVIDGTDASGKKTQVALLADHLARVRVEVETIDFPRYEHNVHGALIRECLDGLHGDFLSIDPKIVSVLYAADRHESREQIQGWLDEGKFVIADRYVSSNQIHQGGKIRDEKERLDFLSWLDELEFGAFKLPRPHAIVYLHVPVEVSMRLARERAIARNESPDTAETNVRHQRESQESALSIIRARNAWHRVDCAPEGAMLPPDVIHGLIWEKIYPMVSLASSEA